MKRRKKRNYNLFAISAVVVLITVSVLFLLNRPFQSAVVEFPDGSKIIAEIADDQEEREKGLSGVRSMPSDSGMLFLFMDPNLYGFWAKDMMFNIDIIWADNAGKVIYIVEDLPPCGTECEVFYPPSGAKFVVEVVGGYASAHGVNIGDTITYEII